METVTGVRLLFLHKLRQFKSLPRFPPMSPNEAEGLGFVCGGVHSSQLRNLLGPTGQSLKAKH